MLKYIVVTAFIVQVAICRPQFITLQDGKLGVNFLGFNANVGLGGLLTGNAAHGGLSASAGTPFGQQAGAGIAGLTGEGRSTGGAYAGASAGAGVGASAAIGGTIDGQGIGNGGLVSESHAGGASRTVIANAQPGFSYRKQISILQPPAAGQVDHFAANANVGSTVEKETPPAPEKIPEPTPDTSVQRIKPPKKYEATPQNIGKRFDINVRNADTAPVQVQPQGNVQGGAVLHKQFSIGSQASPPVQPVQTAVQSNVQATGGVQFGGSSGGLFDSIFNIPISTLRAVNQFLNTKVQAGGSISATKTLDVRSS